LKNAQTRGKWVLEDDKGDMAYNGTVQAQRASYFVMVCRGTLPQPPSAS
jgi:hypothetical protein